MNTTNIKMVLISNVCYNVMIDYVLLMQSLLVLVLDLEERLTILDADLRDDRNRSEDFHGETGRGGRCS